LRCKLSSRLRSALAVIRSLSRLAEGRLFFFVSTFRTAAIAGCSQERAETKNGDPEETPFHFLASISSRTSGRMEYSKAGIYYLHRPGRRRCLSRERKIQIGRCNDATTKCRGVAASRRRSLLHRYRTDTKAWRNGSLNHLGEVARDAQRREIRCAIIRELPDYVEPS